MLFHNQLAALPAPFVGLPHYRNTNPLDLLLANCSPPQVGNGEVVSIRALASLVNNIAIGIKGPVVMIKIRHFNLIVPRNPL